MARYISIVLWLVFIFPFQCTDSSYSFKWPSSILWVSLMAQTVKNWPAIWETQVQSLGREDLLEKEMATESSTLTWKIPWMEKPGRLQSMGSQTVRHCWATSLTHLQLHEQLYDTYCIYISSVQLSSVAQSCPTLCDPMNHSTPGLPVQHQLSEFTQTQVHWVSDAIQPSHPLPSPSPPARSLSQHQGLFQWVSSSHQVATGLELQLQHQSFQWIFKVDFF